MTAPSAPPALFACALLRDHTGRVLLIQQGTDPVYRQPLWWLPGAEVHLPDRGATETVRLFLTNVLGMSRPRLGGMNLTTSAPSAGEPGGKLVMLFDCGTLDATHPFDQDRLSSAEIQNVAWATPQHASASLPPDESAALTYALQHRPSGYYGHLPAPAPAAAEAPITHASGNPPSEQPGDTGGPKLPARTSPPSTLPRRVPKAVPGPANLPAPSKSKPGDLFRSELPPKP